MDLYNKFPEIHPNFQTWLHLNEIQYNGKSKLKVNFLNDYLNVLLIKSTNKYDSSKIPNIF